jgi:hypothetical protein
MQNSGAAASIQTVVPQLISDGSAAFWVGEDLANGAFIQIGYLVENQSGDYPSLCTQSGCSGYEHLTAGDAEWFYEYFPSSSVDAFLGGIGPDGSAGGNGAFNNYSFHSEGDNWYFEVNGKVVGNATLGTGLSGQNTPIAFGEIANTTTAAQEVNPVVFKNLMFYINDEFLPVSQGYSYLGYGVGSSSSIANPYGVQEVKNRVNNFLAGSGLPQPANGAQLWTFGYMLSIVSGYGNVSNSTEYTAYSRASIDAPMFMYVGRGSRGVFLKWMGTGLGSYTGTSNSSTVLMDSNITETMLWQPQYLLDVSSAYGNVSGSGWYNANSLVQYSVRANVIYSNSTFRLLFSGWNDGQDNTTSSVLLVSPVNISAQWRQQYLVNATSNYGNVIGSGWHDRGTDVQLILTEPVVNVSGTEKISFYSWSNGSKSSTLNVNVARPIVLHASYRPQYLVTLKGIDINGNQVAAYGFSIGNTTFNNSAFLYSGVRYTVDSAYYKGYKMQLSSSIMSNSSTSLLIRLPLYPVAVHATDIFGMPVNASVTLQLSNGTEVHGYTGSNGTFVVQDVPLGSAVGSALFSGINESLAASRGTVLHIIYISDLDIAVFVIVIILAAVIYVIASRKVLGHRHEEGGTGGTAYGNAQDKPADQPDQK